MSKRKIAAILAGTSAVGIINSGTSVAFASEREKDLNAQSNESVSNLNEEAVAEFIKRSTFVKPTGVVTAYVPNGYAGNINQQNSYENFRGVSFRDDSKLTVRSNANGLIFSATISDPDGSDYVKYHDFSYSSGDIEPNNLKVYDKNGKLLEKGL